ncbi:MAG: hypothetical protein ACLFSQ_00330 [Candidatus Zixiibacteriota bacterium]
MSTNKINSYSIIKILILLFLVLAGSIFADDDENDDNKSFIKWLMEASDESSSRKTARSSNGESYDYFQDSNDNGIDDRLEKERSKDTNPTKQRKSIINSEPSGKSIGKAIESEIRNSLREDSREDAPAPSIRRKESPGSSKNSKRTISPSKTKDKNSTSNSENKSKKKRIK